VPDVWTKVKIDVQGARAWLYVHDEAQPALVVQRCQDRNPGKGGGVGLWVGAGTVGHFRALKVQRREKHSSRSVAAGHAHKSCGTRTVTALRVLFPAASVHVIEIV
jgi:hypothetical protein